MTESFHSLTDSLDSASTNSYDVPGEFGTTSNKHRHLGKLFARSSSPVATSSSRGIPDSATTKNNNDEYMHEASDATTVSPAEKPDVAVRPAMATPVMKPGVLDIPTGSRPVTEFRVGSSKKQVFMWTDVLVSQSAYFAKLNSVDCRVFRGPFDYPDLDEFAFSLFKHWGYGGKLYGPQDFQSMNQYLGLYIIGMRFEIERLRNSVMDLVRGYYRREQLTAPAYRLELIYGKTQAPCPMRQFLTSTAAYRALHEKKMATMLSENTRSLLRKGGDVSIDFIEALLNMVKNGREDVRKGDDCKWHEHLNSRKCGRWVGFEPFENP